MSAQYWTITGNDIWRMDKREVFDFKNLNTGEVVTCNNATDVKEEKFLPVTMPKVKDLTAKGRRAKTKSPVRKLTTNKKSKHKGVKIAGKKFTGQYWDATNKKVKHCGTFDNELLAAAAVQEGLGNQKEARRLRNEYEEGDCRPEVEESKTVHREICPSEE